jgi:hypothetical protein
MSVSDTVILLFGGFIAVKDITPFTVQRFINKDMVMIFFKNIAQSFFLSLLLLSFIFCGKNSFAEEEYQGLVLQFPLINAPYNFNHKGCFPSMNQSLQYTKDIYQTYHHLFTLGKESHPLLSKYSSEAIDVLSMYLPGGEGWLHEEWHRAVMGQYGINSRNDIYNLKIGATMTAVSHVADADLAWLKNNHPADMVRLSESGIEGEYTLMQNSREDFFFSGMDTKFERFNWFIFTLNSSLYLYICTNRIGEKITKDMNTREHNVRDRDFTGLDFTAWVYDLFRPDEPYALRGVHPLGNSYDRYIKPSDLTEEEKRFLKKQVYFSLINFISPQMLGRDEYKSTIGSSPTVVRWNFALMHYLTSFGTSTELRLFTSFSGYNWTSAFRLYRNETLYLPGIELNIVRYKVKSLPLLIDAGVTFWQQPKDQMFHEKNSKLGNSLKLKVAYPINKRYEFYVTAMEKSKGWQAGAVSLDRSFECIAGMQFILSTHSIKSSNSTKTDDKQ